ncbi:MAG: class I SAM-dependent methyltransferase [Bacteroidota bacterium]|nr:class I SAM-dependent methyltransferase [Bacteroidota bacterium]
MAQRDLDPMNRVGQVGTFTDTKKLVLHEDYQQNLKKLMHSLVSWENKVVVEAGIGTGRVTNLYIEKAKQVYGFDCAPHMLTKLKTNLSDNLHKIKLYNADNLNLLEPPAKGDIFIEGWSFGHTGKFLYSFRIISLPQMQKRQG